MSFLPKGKFFALGKGSKLGRWWDTWIGNEGLVGSITGYGHGGFGNKNRQKSRAIKGIDREISDIRSRMDNIFPNQMTNFNMRNMNDWSALMGKNTESPLTMATDTGKNQQFQNTIQTAINNTNTGLIGSINRAQDRLWSQEDRIADLKAEKQTIRRA
tara:strand:+ start:551 stop:1024 length:474 start_codon:yes stop_codon:yes gene_type:complete